METNKISNVLLEIKHHEYRVTVDLYRRMGFFLNGLYDTMLFNIANRNKKFHMSFYKKNYESLRSKLEDVVYWKTLNIFDSIFEDRMEELKKVDRKHSMNPDFRF